MRYLFILLLYYGCSPKLPIVAQDKCIVISEILKEDHLTDLIDSYENNSLIRIFDLTGAFGKMRCGYDRYSVRVIDKLKVDMNSGRFIDISILSVKDDANLVTFEIFYLKRTSECKRDFLMKGLLIFKKTDEHLVLIDSKFGILD